MKLLISVLGGIMLNLKIGIVEKILRVRNNAIELTVKIDNKIQKAIAYKMFTDIIDIGDKVIINTTAIDLGLGTGGYHFVLANISNPTKESDLEGHIMKLRYTPMQIKVNSCEEQNNRYHNIFNNFESLNNMPVIIGGLHSMLAPLSVVLKHDNRLKICYIMTDGGALPIDFSKTVFILKKEKYIDETITIGHSFGGDLECINIYNALIAAKEIVKCDIAIVTMGPGIIGTGTKFGFSGIEQGAIIDAVNDLGGLPICVPRISFLDKRKRHYGISHHTITVLKTITKTKGILGIPNFDSKRLNFIKNQIKINGIDKKHDIIYLEFDDIIEVLKNSSIPMITMGRSVANDIEYFATVGVNAKLAINYLCYPKYFEKER